MSACSLYGTHGTHTHICKQCWGGAAAMQAVVGQTLGGLPARTAGGIRLWLGGRSWVLAGMVATVPHLAHTADCHGTSIPAKSHHPMPRHVHTKTVGAVRASMQFCWVVGEGGALPRTQRCRRRQLHQPVEAAPHTRPRPHQGRPPLLRRQLPQWRRRPTTICQILTGRSPRMRCRRHQL
jgi:hypothetical protein